VFCEVIPLRSSGLRLRPDEWPAPARGRLEISHMPASICAARRTLREVRLLGEWVSHPMVTLLMFDPEFVDVVGDGFLLRGHVIEVQDGRQYEHEQLWLVRPSAGPDVALPAFDAARWARSMPIGGAGGNGPSVSERWHEANTAA
jgi:hypothetical protein